MLNKLNKHSGYVTHEELRNVLKYLEKIKKGDPGKDAVVSSAVIKQIKAMVKPIKNVDYKDGDSYVLTEDDKIEIANYSMDRVKEHVLTDVISQDALVNLIRRQRGKDGLYVDNIRGLKKHINNILVNNQSINAVNENVIEQGESIHKLSDHISQLEINIASGESRSVVCAAGPPTSPGRDGDVQFDSSTNTKYEFLCGAWYTSVLTPLDSTPPTTNQQCDILLDELGNVVLDELGNAVLVNCVPIGGRVLGASSGSVVVDSDGRVIRVIN